MRYVLIGHSFASTFAVEAIRKVDRSGEIIVISDEPHRLYSRAMLHELLGGMVSDRLCWLRDENWAERYNVRLLIGKRAVKIDANGRNVYLDDGQQIGFDKLLIACGSKPFVPPGIVGIERYKDVYTFTQLNDVHSLRQSAQVGGTVVVLGAGLIGLQCAEGLRHLGACVHVVELADQVLPMALDRQAAQLITEALAEESIELHLSDSIAEICGEGERISSVRLKSGKELPCQTVVIAVGVRPNVAWLADSGLAIDRGILVDEHLQTNLPDIYAAGDCAQALEKISRQKTVLPAIPVASKQGLLAGYNMAGVKRIYDGEIPLNALQFGPLQVISYGIVRTDGEDLESPQYLDKRRRIYKKVVLREKRVVGALLVRAIDRAGLYRELIDSGIDISGMRDRLVAMDFGVGDLPRTIRDELFTAPQYAAGSENRSRQ